MAAAPSEAYCELSAGCERTHCVPKSEAYARERHRSILEIGWLTARNACVYTAAQAIRRR